MGDWKDRAQLAEAQAARLRQRVAELEAENERLRHRIEHPEQYDADGCYVGLRFGGA